MANKIINGRIVHKHDTEANWNKATNFIPKQGELIIYDVDENYNYERFKIGDGKTIVSSLPFGNIPSDGTITTDKLSEDVQSLLNSKGLNIGYIWWADQNAVSSIDRPLWKIGSISDFAYVGNAFTVMSASSVTLNVIVPNLDASTVTPSTVVGGYELFNNGDMLVYAGKYSLLGVTATEVWKRIPMHEAKENLDGLMSAWDKQQVNKIPDMNSNLTALLNRYVAYFQSAGFYSADCSYSGLYGNITSGRPGGSTEPFNMISVKDNSTNYTSQLAISEDNGDAFIRGRISGAWQQLLKANQQAATGGVFKYTESQYVNWFRDPGIYDAPLISAPDGKANANYIVFVSLGSPTGTTRYDVTQIAVDKATLAMYERHTTGFDKTKNEGIGNYATGWVQIYSGYEYKIAAGSITSDMLQDEVSYHIKEIEILYSKVPHGNGTSSVTITPYTKEIVFDNTEELNVKANFVGFTDNWMLSFYFQNAEIVFNLTGATANVNFEDTELSAGKTYTYKLADGNGGLVFIEVDNITRLPVEHNDVVILTDDMADENNDVLYNLSTKNKEVIVKTSGFTKIEIPADAWEGWRCFVNCIEATEDPISLTIEGSTDSNFTNGKINMLLKNNGWKVYECDAITRLPIDYEFNTIASELHTLVTGGALEAELSNIVTGGNNDARTI